MTRSAKTAAAPGEKIEDRIADAADLVLAEQAVNEEKEQKTADAVAESAAPSAAGEMPESLSEPLI